MRRVLISITLPFIILLVSYNLVAFNFNFYQSEFEKYNVYEKLDKKDVDREANNIISYLKTGDIKTEYFNEKELLHLKDVYSLNVKARYLFYISLVITLISLISLIYSKKYKEALNAILIGSILAAGLLIFLAVLSLTNFSTSFTNFHELLFKNEYWKLDPGFDKMIVMFPEGFFYDAFIRIIIYDIAISLSLIVISEALSRTIKLKNKG